MTYVKTWAQTMQPLGVHNLTQALLHNAKRPNTLH